MSDLKSDTLPPGWAQATLDEIGEVILGQSPPGHSYNVEGYGVPFLQGKAEFGDLRPTVRKWTTDPRKLACENDVLLSVRAPVGPTNLAPLDCCIGRGLAAIRPGGRIEPLFVLYAMRATASSLVAQSTGSTFEAVSGAQVKAHRLPVPPLNEQRRIVAAIEEHLSLLDAADASLATALARIDPFGQLVAANASVGQTTVSLGSICPVFVDCPHRTPKYSVDGVPALRPRDVVGGRMRLETAARVDRKEFEIQTRRRVPVAGDVVYSRELSYGWAVVVPEGVDVCLSQGMVLFRPDDSVSSEFLAVILNSRFRRRQAAAAATGSAHPHLNLRDIRAYEIPLPPLAEQRRIVARVEEQLSAIDALRAAIERAQLRSASLRRSILERAFRGELVPQDPADEPAEALLARIRADRAAAPPLRHRTVR